ncbi:MAG: hypothetical protein IKQ41_03040 [Clostridia bacterium]|nr:hypothetical protein [Clostridia bacterium]
MPHALLLTGESGVGKRTLAGLLAQGLLCTGEGEKPCGQCRGCRRFLSRTHPDAFFPAPLPKEKTIRIDTLRRMVAELGHHSLEGGRRVVLIENAEMMLPAAQNCLLKTLEDTQEDTYFLLTCDVETALLPTVRSRCRVIRMQPWQKERLEKELKRRGIEEKRARALASYCEGSLGRALAMQQDQAYWDARELVRKTFLSVQSVGDIASAAQRLRDQKDNGDRLLKILEQEIRTLMHERTLRGQDTADDFPSFWLDAPPQALRAILEAVLAARRQKNANVGWAALSEGLMLVIAEETKKWQA